RFGEANGSTIMAVINSIKGEIQGGSLRPGAIPKDTDPYDGYFASQVKYVKLAQGVGRVSILYPCDTVTTIGENTTDTVTVYLQERVPTSEGGVNFVPIGEPIEKTISIAESCGTTLALKIDEVEINPEDEEAKVEDRADGGITIWLTAGKGGTKIHVKDDNFGNLRRGKRAPGNIRMDLDFESEELGGFGKGDGEPEYTYTAKMVRGEAIITLDEKITKRGTYDLTISPEDGEDEETDAQKPPKNKLVVRPRKQARGLKLRSDRERITMPSPDIFDAYGECPDTFPEEQVCYGAEITLTVLDEFGNRIENTKNNDFNVSVIDQEGVVSNSALKFKVEKDSSYGTANPTILETDTGIETERLDEKLGNQKGEIIRLGTTSLVAQADHSGITDSEPLAIEVIKDALLVEVLEPEQAHRVGTEFEAFILRVGNGLGQVYLQDKEEVVDYHSIGNKPTHDPGSVEVLTQAGESRSFSRLPDGTDKVEAFFKQDSRGSRDYIVSDTAGQYSEVRLSEAWEIKPGAVNQIALRDSEGNKVEIKPDLISAEKRYKTSIRENAFEVFDVYGNLITHSTSTNMVFDSLGNSVTNATHQELELGQVRAKTEQGYVQYSAGDDYANVGGSGEIEVLYDKGFSGLNTIELSFTHPGLTDKKIYVTSDVPSLEEPEEETKGSIQAYIETTNIPVDGEVAVTLETSLKSVTLQLSGKAGDDLVPNVYELVWDDAPFSEQQCDKAGGTFENDQCQITETHCQASGYLFFKDQCWEQEDKLLASGSTLDFTAVRSKVLVVKAGPREGQFSITFTDPNNPEIEESLTFNVTKSAQEPVGPTEPEPTEPTDPTEPDDSKPVPATQEECRAEGYLWDNEACEALPTVNNLIANGKTPMLLPDGQYGTADAKITGGFDIGKHYEVPASFRLTDSADVTLATLIQFDPSHVGETVDILAVFSYAINNPLAIGGTGETLWFSVSEIEGVAPFENMASLEAFMSKYEITEESNPLVLGPYPFGNFNSDNFSPGTLGFQFGYRLDAGQIIYNGQPISLIMVP
ncbi:MAG: hypothetical protein VSS75_032950, partial [Candidatus Parabeggiatoa sp.]|nr:hypothetical protein [Candidatus Parabeggiatoa sp.]